MAGKTPMAGWRILALGAVVLSLGACTDYKDYATFMKKPRPVVGGKPYVIEPPDAVTIIAPNAPEINNVTQTLRPDGKITLYLLGDVFAAGKTPTQLASEIEEKISEYYEDVTVQIQMSSFASKTYYMAGETAMGPKPYTGKDTVLDAALGAGIYRTSWPERAVVLRPNEEGELIRRMTVDLTDMYEMGDLKYNAVLEEGDIVFIPTNPVAIVGIFIQNLISPVQPVIQAASVPASFTGLPVPR